MALGASYRMLDLDDESPGRALMKIWELFGGAWRDASGGGVSEVDSLVSLWGNSVRGTRDKNFVE